jgi:hypothetical protein
MTDEFDKAEVPEDRLPGVIAALVNHGRQHGGGLASLLPVFPIDAAREEVAEAGRRARARGNGLLFDYVGHIAVKVRWCDGKLSGLVVYDRDNGGPGTGIRVVREALAEVLR